VGSHDGGLCVEEGSGTGVSPYRGFIGGHGEGSPSAGDFDRWLKGALGDGAFLAMGVL